MVPAYEASRTGSFDHGGRHRRAHFSRVGGSGNPAPTGGGRQLARSQRRNGVSASPRSRNCHSDSGNLRYQGQGLLSWLGLPFRLAKAVVQASRAFGQASPACAISFGGYAAGPGGLAAKLRGVPLLVHEQNRVPGMTNKVLARLARTVLQAFPGTWPASLNAVDCGNPVRSSVVQLAPPEQRMAGRSGAVRLLITGGSQGARALNRVVPAALELIPAAQRPVVIHQAGKGWQAETSEAYAKAGVECEVTEFIDDMAGAYGWADLVVCRAGALTVSELAAAGLAFRAGSFSTCCR